MFVILVYRFPCKTVVHLFFCCCARQQEFKANAVNLVWCLGLNIAQHSITVPQTILLCKICEHAVVMYLTFSHKHEQQPDNFLMAERVQFKNNIKIYCSEVPLRFCLVTVKKICLDSGSLTIARPNYQYIEKWYWELRKCGLKSEMEFGLSGGNRRLNCIHREPASLLTTLRVGSGSTM